MFKLDYNDHRPVYEQIKENFKNLIMLGILAESEAMPSVRELAANLCINPNTIQRAYKELEAEGFIYSIRAKGSFVAPKSNTLSKDRKSKLVLDINTILSELSFGGVKKEEIIEIVNQFYKGRENN